MKRDVPDELLQPNLLVRLLAWVWVRLRRMGNLLISLLEHQPWLSSVQIYNGETVDYDLDLFRKIPNLETGRSSILPQSGVCKRTIEYPGKFQFDQFGSCGTAEFNLNFHYRANVHARKSFELK
jgi:hypothetical protein